MAFLKASKTYIWSTTSVLGRGATGAVYQGINQQTGEPVAVKTFNQMSHARPIDVQMREFEVLKKVKHDNIVKLLAIEEEKEGTGKIIVMELCTGGSLFNILDDPENTNGLDEKEYLLVLSHLTAGIKHLRENKIVHRDLKPGNIMKYIAADGSTVYKLVDFGAARELDDDQQFLSLYGTEEYLHPYMFQKAVMKQNTNQSFCATTDLWSIGVTLYHVATGSLPFRPFGGRRNKETMHDITTKKASGVISGIQTIENGPIEWGRELPNSCLLSHGLKQLVTPLLAGLLEIEKKKMWTYDRFFCEVNKILSCCKLHIFYVNELSLVNVFMRPLDKYDDLGLLISEQIDISTRDQILVYKDHLLDYFVSKDDSASKYPVTTPDDPILLFHRQNNNIGFRMSPVIGTFPPFPNVTSLDSDASTAKLACSSAHIIKRTVDRFCQVYKLMHYCAHMLSSLIIQNLQQLKHENDNINRLTNCLTHRLDLILNSHQFCSTLAKGSYNTKYDNSQPKLEKIIIQNRQKHQSLCQRLDPTKLTINQLYSINYIEKKLMNDWACVTSSTADIRRCCNKAEYYVLKLRESWQHLLRDKAARSLKTNEETFHKLEKIKAQENYNSLLDIVQKDCHPATQRLSEEFSEWYNKAQTVFVKEELLHSELEAVQELHDDINGAIDEAQQIFIDHFSKLILSSGENEIKSPGKVKNLESHRLNSTFAELQAQCRQMYALLQQNTQNVKMLDELMTNGTKNKFT